MEKLYRIEELCTSGWELIDPEKVKLTKDQCKVYLEDYIASGYNPNALRAVVDND